MSKLGPDGQPIRRADGKVLKGPNFVPPDMTAALSPPPSSPVEPAPGQGGPAERFKRLVAGLEAIELHGLDDRFPCHAICDADCIEVMRETAAAARRAVTEETT